MADNDMSINKTVRILQHARENGYAVPAMCCYNLEGVLATIRGAEAENSPAMVLFFPWAIEYAGDILIRAAGEACRAAKVPIALHLDHAQDPEIVRRAAGISGGFDSIMCDMSHYETQENLRLTAELTNLCHARGIATEAEPGRIEGGEDGVSETVDLESILTTPEQAREFVATGIDLLAPAFGNVHGKYGPRGIQLDYDRLERINAAVGGRVQLVLHGADGFTQEIYQQCITRGIAKVNINGAMNDEYLKVQQRSRGVPITSIITQGTSAMEAAVRQATHDLGSAGKASLF